MNRFFLRRYIEYYILLPSILKDFEKMFNRKNSIDMTESTHRQTSTDAFFSKKIHFRSYLMKSDVALDNGQVKDVLRRYPNNWEEHFRFLDQLISPKWIYFFDWFDSTEAGRQRRWSSHSLVFLLCSSRKYRQWSRKEFIRRDLERPKIPISNVFLEIFAVEFVNLSIIPFESDCENQFHCYTIIDQRAIPL